MYQYVVHMNHCLVETFGNDPNCLVLQTSAYPSRLYFLMANGQRFEL